MEQQLPKYQQQIDSIRQNIDSLDEKILNLLNERAKFAEQIGQVKRENNGSFFRPDRVASLIAGLQTKNQGPLENTHIGNIWREIVSACLALEVPIQVAYLGPSGTFSEIATLKFFGSNVGKVVCASFDEIFRATSTGMAQFGVVPIENSTEGIVSRTLDLLRQENLHIVGEINLPVHHNLLRKIDSMDAISKVCAHPQALAQCHGWLSTNLPNAQHQAVSSNAEGARLAMQNPDWAAVAGEKAGIEFGLYNVANGIQDIAGNRTRFVVVCLPSVLEMPQATSNDQTSVIISIKNRSGALHDLLLPFKQNDVSLLRLESRPSRSGQWEYYFYVDIDGHMKSEKVAKALEQVRELSDYFKLLGSYSRATD